MDGTRHFIAREPLLDICQECCCVRLLIGMDCDESYSNLAPMGIGLTADASLADRWMCQEYAFDFGGIDILAAGDDQIRAAIEDVKIAVCVEIAQISGTEPAILQCLSRCVRPIGVTWRDCRALQVNDTWLAR